MSLEFVVVAEAPADFEIATEIADRVIRDAALRNDWHWIVDGNLDDYRIWKFELENRPLTWAGIHQEAKRHKIKHHGFRNNAPALIETRSAQNAISVAKLFFPNCAAILLVRDLDDQPERLQGLQQARELETVEFVIGCPNPEREAWILSGFDPVDANETELLEVERARLGFDPRFKSHDLGDTRNDQGKKSAKRVVAELTSNSLDRQRNCWKSTALPTLRERGAENGLNDLLDEIESRLVPLFGSQR